jgi:hypothetical protein
MVELLRWSCISPFAGVSDAEFPDIAAVRNVDTTVDS